MRRRRKVKVLTIEDNSLAKDLFGKHNENLRIIENALDIRISARGNNLNLEGEPSEVELAEKLVKSLYSILQKGHPLSCLDVDYAIRILKADHLANLEEIFLDSIQIFSEKRVITPKSINQKKYVEYIKSYDIVCSIGPAGTGKTYLAMAMAVSFLIQKRVNRIVLARPAVEAGEKLGFLPGSLQEKVNPYLRPLYDALHDMMDFEKTARLIERGIIEVAPLAFMRGRTLNDSFVVLDEAQNTTSEQMKMFLTRLGFSSKAVITGDITQIDLPNGKTSGLVEAQRILRDIEGIKFIYFSEKDVIRHRLVQEIIKAYEVHENNQRSDKINA